jgi:two-component system, cell cycle response regulator DivK
MTDQSKPLPCALIVEDDEKLAVIFTQALKQAAFETETIRNGREALARLSELMPAVVVLDLHLPEVSGGTILESIRQDPRLAKTQVILTTADAALADVYEAQADLVLIKPVSFSQLRDLASRLREHLT